MEVMLASVHGHQKRAPCSPAHSAGIAGNLDTWQTLGNRDKVIRRQATKVEDEGPPLESGDSSVSVLGGGADAFTSFERRPSMTSSQTRSVGPYVLFFPNPQNRAP
jgi:hypothetical protein